MTFASLRLGLKVTFASSRLGFGDGDGDGDVAVVRRFMMGVASGRWVVGLLETSLEEILEGVLFSIGNFLDDPTQLGSS